MFGNIYKSCLSINNFLWEPVGVVFLIALVFLLWDKKKFWKDPFFITSLISCVFLLAWRIYINASGRYFAITALPVLLIIFNFIWRVPFPKALRCFLFAGAVFACFCRDMRGNCYEKSVIALCRRAGDDSARYSKPAAITFTSQSGRERFYSGLNVCGVDREISREEVLNNLRGNLTFFSGINDVVYIFIDNRSNNDRFAGDFCQLMPENSVELLGRSYIDRSRKKEFMIFKYEVPKTVASADISGFKLMDNGDFSRVLRGKQSEDYNDRLARRAPLFGKLQPQLPEKFHIYHSLTAFSDSIAGVEKRPDKNVLRVEANGSYLGVITPQIDMRRERYISFDLKVNRKSSLQINRGVHGRGLFPFFTVELDKAPEKRYVLRLEKSGTNGDFWFWLNGGDIELSNLRIK